MKHRVVGFDLARALAIFGMVILNFKIVMSAYTGNEFLLWVTDLLEGRASALFVVLAGVGVTFLTNRARASKDKSVVLKSRLSLIKRGLLLVIVGLAYTPLWEGDILHFYGFYFLFASFLFMANDKNLLRVAFAIMLAFPVLMLFFNYDQGWDWTTFTYEDLWSFNGMLRNIMFNGFHPVIPWTAFLIFGMWMGRQDLSQNRIRNKLFVWSLVVLIATEGSLYIVRAILAQESIAMGNESAMSYEEIAYLLHVSVMPPLPQYILSAGSSAVIVLIGSLYFSERYSESRFTRWLYQTGQLSLTLYVAHVVIGMGFLEYIGRIENQTINFSVFSAIVFCVCGIVFSVIWLKYFKTGPLEWCFRKITS